MPKRVAFIDLTFNWPPVGGCWVDLKEIMSRLPSFGYEVKLFVPDWEDYYPRGRITEALPFPVEKIPFNRFTFNAHTARKRFRGKVDEFGADLVFIGDGYFLKGALLPAFRDLPVIMRIYSYELLCINLHYYDYHKERICDGNFLTDPERCHRCWYPRTLSPYKHLLGIVLGVEDKHPKLHFSQEYLASLAFTRGYRESLKEWLGIPKAIVVYNDFTKDFLTPYNRGVEVIPSGIDTKVFTPAVSQDRAPGPLRILMTGRINDPLKGFPVTKRATDALHAEGRSFELLITSAMDMGDVKAPYLKNLGWFPPDQLPDLYRRADVCLAPSTWIEPFGITALESMACGVPVVASRVGGLAHSVVDGKTGLHFEAGNSEDLRRAISVLMDDPNLRRSMGEAGRQRTREIYDWDVLMEKRYMPLLKKCMG